MKNSIVLNTDLANHVWEQIDSLIEDANSNADCKGYCIICSALNIPNDINELSENLSFWDDIDEIETNGEKFVSFAVSDYNDLVMYTSEYNGEY